MTLNDLMQDGKFTQELNKAHRSLSNMPISERISTWQEIHGRPLDTSNLDFDPTFIPHSSFNPDEISSVFGIKVTYDKLSNKVEPINLKPKDNSLQQAKEKSLQDLKDLGSNLHEGLKLIDITGVLHWEDYINAKEEFEKSPNKETSLHLILATLAVIPAVGIASVPSRALRSAAQTAPKASLRELTQNYGKLSEAEKNLKYGPALKEVETLLKINQIPPDINKKSLSNALMILDRRKNKLNPTVPAPIFKEMIKDFKANGGKFQRKDGNGNFQDHSDNIITLDPLAGSFRGDFRSVISHEMGHSFTLPKNPRSNELPQSTPFFNLTKNKSKNPHDWRSSQNFVDDLNITLLKEINADLEVIRRLKVGGASKQQISQYANDAIKGVQAYKRGFFVEENIIYSQAIAVKKTLLDTKATLKNFPDFPDLSGVSKKVLHRNPGLISNFDKLLEAIAIEYKKRGQPLIAKQVLSPELKGIKSTLYTEKTIASNKHYKIKNELDNIYSQTPKKRNIQTSLKYMEKNLEDFGYFKNLITQQIDGLRIRELEKYVIPTERTIRSSIPTM